MTCNWSGKLNFSRTCTSKRPQDRCWLITDLKAWNSVLYRLNYELAETCPGKLALRYVKYAEGSAHGDTSAQAAASLISWLVENHSCIDELRIFCTVRPDNAAREEAPVPLRLRLPPGKGIRSFCVDMCADNPGNRVGCWYLPEEEMEALRGIEELEICCCDASLEAGLVKLLRSNSKSLKFVNVTHWQLSERLVDGLLYLEMCESFTAVRCGWHRDTSWDVQAMTRLLDGLDHVKEFRYLPGWDSDFNTACVVKALRSNTNLTVLELKFSNRRSLSWEFFAALEDNRSVQTLHILFSRHDTRCGDALASALCKNTCLLHLCLGGRLNIGSLASLAAALSRNTTLKRLEFKSCTLDAEGASILCDALRTNKTLQQLVLSFPALSNTERGALAQKLAHGDGYSRVQLPHLEDCDIPPLSALLACPSSGPKALSSFNMASISDSNLKLLFGALALNLRVKKLSIDILENQREQTSALCAMIRRNRSIESISVFMFPMIDGGDFLRQLLDALGENKTISQLSISPDENAVGTASVLSDFFAVNRRISKFWMCSLDNEVSFLDEVSRGVAMNPVIIEFERESSCPPNYLISETLRRNRSALNRAVDFVVHGATDKKSAEAFELFSGRPCLVAHIVKASGQTDFEALNSIRSAEKFLQNNYFVVTGVVRHRITCHPANGGTQLDELNAYCWLAIVSHLKVSDVIG